MSLWSPHSIQNREGVSDRDPRVAVELDSRPEVDSFESFDQNDVRGSAVEQLARRLKSNALRSVAGENDRLAIAGKNHRSGARGLELGCIAAALVIHCVMRVLDGRDAMSACYEMANQGHHQRGFARARLADDGCDAHLWMTIRFLMRHSLLLMLFVANALFAAEPQKLTIALEPLGDSDAGVVARLTFKFVIGSDVPGGVPLVVIGSTTQGSTVKPFRYPLLPSQRNSLTAIQTLQPGDVEIEARLMVPLEEQAPVIVSRTVSGLGPSEMGLRRRV